MGLIAIIGLPDAGKTTYSERFEHVLHLDDFPPSKFLNCNKAVAEAGGDITVEGIYNLRCRRERLLEAAKEKPGPRVCIWLDTPFEECLRRSAHGRSEDIVRMGAAMLQPPTLDEGWDEIQIIRGEAETVIRRTDNERLETVVEGCGDPGR